MPIKRVARRLKNDRSECEMAERKVQVGDQVSFVRRDGRVVPAEVLRVRPYGLMVKWEGNLGDLKVMVSGGKEGVLNDIDEYVPVVGYQNWVQCSPVVYRPLTWHWPKEETNV